MAASLKLTWADTSLTVTYQIEMSLVADGTGFTLLGSPIAGARTYTAQNLEENKMHYFRARAVDPRNSAVVSDWTPIVGAKTAIAKPATPTGLTVTPL